MKDTNWKSYSASEFSRWIEEAIAKMKLPAHLPGLYGPINYIMGLGGKRLRPCLTLMGCNLYSEQPEKTLDVALGIELFHNFTLMHDDIMDQAPLRRGAITVHEKWDANTAILSGDVMLVEAYKRIAAGAEGQAASVASGQCLALFSKAAGQVCEGQQMDMDFEKRSDVGIADYLQMIELKTAVLLGASLEIGALCGGASAAEARQLYDFGKNLGIAFQLQDDYLDLYGDPEKFGKQIGGDILANKKTYLLLKAYELAETQDRETLDQWMTESISDPEEKIKAVRAVYDSLGIPEKIKTETGLFIAKAFDHLDQVSVASVRKEVLRRFSESLLAREK